VKYIRPPTSYPPFKPQWSLYIPPGLTFNNSNFCPHSVLMCFVWMWEQTANISLYSINWLVFVTETDCDYWAVRSAHTQHLCVAWIWEQTAIISLYSINWLVFITEKECVYCAVRSAHTVYLCVLCGSENKQRLFHYTTLTDWFL
jgi:predicted GNAT family N-acyltransferase